MDSAPRHRTLSTRAFSDGRALHVVRPPRERATRIQTLKALHEKWTAERTSVAGVDLERAHHLAQALADLRTVIRREENI